MYTYVGKTCERCGSPFRVGEEVRVVRSGQIEEPDFSPGTFVISNDRAALTVEHVECVRPVSQGIETAA